MNLSTPINENSSHRVLANDPDWWRGAVIYQIYPRSFADSNGDGIGDLPGITEKLDYISDLGADAIWISPFMKSPMDDFGYDVSDYEDVDPMFGSLDDFKELIAKAHGKGIRVLIDLVISHTSDQHEWFVESRSNKTNSKSDWYVWADPKADGSPPNNWLSIFGGSAWQWDSRRCQYYLHNFLRSQPDLNFHCEEVQQAVLDAGRFWLELGVDGFRLDTVNFYVHDKQLRDNPPYPDPDSLADVTGVNPYAFQDHKFDKSQPENLPFLERLRAVMNEYPNTTTVGEIGAGHEASEIMAQYTSGEGRLHMAYSFDLLSNTPTAKYVRERVTNLQNIVTEGWPSWAMSNHDVKRMGSRLPADVDPQVATPALMALSASLRGSPCIYQGEELGFKEADVALEDLQDPYGIEFWPEYKGRDGCRTPIAWTKDGGFTTGKPWLPMAQDHLEHSAEAQAGDEASPLRRTAKYLQWRKDQKVLQKGSLDFVDLGEDVLAFVREHEGEKVLCVFNLTNNDMRVALGAYSSAALLEGHGFSAEMDGEALNLPAWQVAYLQISKN
ncbi:alpha-glucosidase family protein [Pseudovibrio ascidiaceicola]|uniref:alpha-glucosidase family protein n=1 Tax=Pseudovibrio ascidiaceicola TaxID=285279 RepID=UPI000D69848D|nr:alpha-glucosidase family protein [Pseudovibrio ascidiaceicola]